MEVNMSSNLKYTCKDCVHCEVCDYWYKEAYPNDPEPNDYSICRDFKNKNNFIEVPCTIGQPMWRLVEYTPEIQESKVSMIQQKVDKTLKFRVSICGQGYTCDYKAEDIGKNIFLSKTEALAALTKAEETNE